MPKCGREEALRKLLGQAGRVQSAGNPHRRKEFYERWRREVKGVLTQVPNAPALKLSFKHFAEDLAMLRAYVSAAAAPPLERGGEDSVFVVHGRDEQARRDMFEFLRAIGLHPIEWAEALGMTATGAPFIGEVLDRALDSVFAVVVVITPDDEARLRPLFVKPHDPEYEKTYTAQARPNVLFEAGMAFGRRPEKTILVQLGNTIRPFSDIAGRYVIHLDGSAQSRRTFVAILKRVGCPVKDEGTDWLQVGTFAPSQ